MKRYLLMFMILLSLLLIGCNDTKEKEKEPEQKNIYEEVIFHLDDATWASEGSFRIDEYASDMKNKKVISIVSKDNIDITSLIFNRICVKHIEKDIYQIVGTLLENDSWQKVSEDYDYVIIGCSDIEDINNYTSFTSFAYSLKAKGKFMRFTLSQSEAFNAYVYEREEYARGIDKISLIENEYIIFNGLYKEGYRFNGWYDNSNLSGEKVSDYLNSESSKNEFYPSFSLERYTISYYYNGGSAKSNPVSDYTYESEDINLITDLEKEGYKFEGWYDNAECDGEKITSIPKHSSGNKYLYANWLIKEIADLSDEEKVEYASNKLVALYSTLTEIERDITLRLKDADTNAVISWTSSNEDVLSSDGEYTRNYQASTVTLTATVSLNEASKILSFDITCKGFKNIDKIGIASSYIYRNFDKVDNLFFDTLDIINCSFAKGNANGTVTGTNFFKLCSEKIIPRAHQKGDWVVMSIAPDSDWVALCNPENNMVDTFCDNIIKAINEYGFDGVDIDWECPTSAQKTWFTNLVKTLREKMTKNNPNHILSAAIGGGRWQPPYYDMTNSVKYLDFVNMMTYGMTSSSGQYHNSLYKNSSYNDATNKVGYTLVSCSIIESIEIYDSYNVPHKKIIVGLAFYGIKQSREYDETTKTYSSWGKGGSIFYTSIKNNYLNNPDYTYVYDTRCGVPYLISKDKTVFISFDDVRSIKEKCHYVLDHNIGGVMYWENGCDTTGDLIGAINSVLS
ncbi:MAG: InlB B-repeat-containing protein [Bacilli bacterium]|nr:InlB B-repeat-containing protein [Bacilli bacterium]